MEQLWPDALPNITFTEIWTNHFVFAMPFPQVTAAHVVVADILVVCKIMYKMTW